MRNSMVKRALMGCLWCVMSLAMSAQAEMQASAGELHWVSAWGAAPVSAGDALKVQSVRQVIRTSIAGSAVRIRLSNLYGAEPLTIGSVRVARSAGKSAIDVATAHAVTFGGKTSVTIAKGDAALSDPVALPVAALEQLAVSLYLPEGAKYPTVHGAANQDAYFTNGDATAAAEFPAGEPEDRRYFLTDVEVAAAPGAHAIVVVGDSITDGVGSTENRNARWPDALAERLQADPALVGIAVVNSGIAGNRILNDGVAPYRGPSSLARFDRDALSKPGVRWIVLLQGGNDISASDVLKERPDQKVSARQIIDGMKSLIARAREKGIKILGATLLPRGGTEFPAPPTREALAKREEVNAWGK